VPINLPAGLQSKLDVLARRSNRIRWLRGTSLTVLVIVLGAGLLLLLDALLEMPSAARWILGPAWVIAVILVVRSRLLRPISRSVPAPALAAAVEEEYPRLGERLTSAVELADADEYHGSPAFVRILMREADQKARTLDFSRAAPRNVAEWLTAAAVAAVFVVISPLLFVPDYYLGLTRRLFMPWDRRPAVVPYRVDTAPGDGYAARGRPVTISARLVPIRDRATLPDVCTLIVDGDNGKPLRLRMAADAESHAFAFRLGELKGNLRFHVEAGPIQTERRTIIAVEPVELAGGPTVTLTPPVYAKSIAAQKVEGTADLAVLEHGRVAFDCRFDRPAEAATLLTSPTSGPTTRQPLTLSGDRRSGRIEFPATAGARLRLELAAEHHILTVTPEQSFVIVPDRPPDFRSVSGLPTNGAIRPTEKLTLDLTVTDDVEVAGLSLEFRVNEGPVQKEAVSLPGLGTPAAVGRALVALAGKVKDGDKLAVRLIATDNRNVPEARLAPNIATFPSGDRWAEFLVSGDAGSLRQQEVVSRRDDIEKRLRELIVRVNRAARQTYALHQDIENSFPPAEEQVRNLRNLSNEREGLSRQLEGLAKDADLGGLKPLAEQMSAVKEVEMRQAGEAFREATTATDRGRVAPLKRADATLTEARVRLEGLLRQNRDLADARLDELKLDDLAERERELAEQTKPVATPEEMEKLAKKQERLAEELKKLANSDQNLQDAVREAQADELRRLAEQARALAEAERRLDAQIAEAQRQRNAERFGDLARRQQELAADADRLATQTRAATTEAGVKPLDSQPASQAADDLRAGDADSAQRREEQVARDLDKLADELRKGIEAAKDPREAARRLSRLQEENRRRVSRPAESAEARRQQEAISKAVADLRLPEDNAAARRDRQQAAELAAEAARALDRNDSKNAEFRMGQAKETLDRIAGDLPTVENRLRRARDEVAQLRQAQEEVTRQADKASRSTQKGDQKSAAEERADAARQQADVAERLNKLDTPGQDERRQRAAAAAARAQDDLQSPALADVPASQADARRSLERLAEALSGQTPADDKARDLAQRERTLADEAGAADDPAARREQQARQEKIAQETQGLNATEAPVRHGEASRAAIQANSALRDKPEDRSTVDKMRSAAEKLEALADQLAGRETAAQRADRLAKKQAAAVEQISSDPIDAKRQTNEIASETQQVRAGKQAAESKREAVEKLTRVQRTAENSPEHSQAQREAAAALGRMADQLAKSKEGNPKPSAESLARQQRDLAAQTATAAPSPESFSQLADKQQRLREQAGRLASDQAPKAVQLSRQAMEQAEQALARRDTAEAARRQGQAADELDKAARQASTSTRQETAPATPPDGMPSPSQVDQAREMARRQRDLLEDVRRAAATDMSTEAERAVARRQQDQLSQQAGELARSLDESSAKTPGDETRQTVQGAAKSARQGEKALQQAQDADAGQARTARKAATDALNHAAAQADQAAKGQQSGQPGKGTPQAGQEIQSAQGQMGQAQNQLGQGQSREAGESMRRAAEALRNAAQQLAQRSEPRAPREGAERPAEGAVPGTGTPTSAELPKDLQKYAGKKWGELPGDLRTRIVQEMKAQYGDDYARVIKLYFEQIAETGKK
jgi:hypothetical protein